MECGLLHEVTVKGCESMDVECSLKDLHVKGLVTKHGNGGKMVRKQGHMGGGYVIREIS